MSYLQFGGRDQNLKSSSLENLKVAEKLYVLNEATLKSCRFIDKLSFTEAPSLELDLTYWRRLFAFFEASEDGANKERVPLNYLDISNISVKEEFNVVKLRLDSVITYTDTSETVIRNFIGFPDRDNEYLDLSGSNNITFGRLALRDISGNSNIAIGNSPTDTAYGYTLTNNCICNNNIIVGNEVNFTDGASELSDSIVLGNGMKISQSNTIYLGSTAQTSLETYAYLNVNNGVYLGKDISNSTFIFDNLTNHKVTSSDASIISRVSDATGQIISASSTLNYYGAKNYIELRGLGHKSDLYSWKILLQTDDNDSVSLGIHKSLIFLSPSGRGYYLRDDPISDGTSNTGGTGSINITSFTGQHSVILDSSYKHEIGKIVVSLGTFNNFSSGVAKNSPNMNESLPLVGYSKVNKDKRVFGVLSTAVKLHKGSRSYTYNEGPWSTEINSTVFKNRCWANSIGEGAILVTNANGNLENGDYITTGGDEGYGIKQDDDVLHSYTVAKITENMDFSDTSRVKEVVLNGITRKVCLVGCTYHCG